jgi:ribosomal protein S18 acetylase RimI-like enzyme
MNEKIEKTQVLRLIDEGANFYLRLLGDAEHMDYRRNDCYAIIRPRPFHEGGTSLFDVRLEHLPEEEIEQKVAEIKQMDIHTWWGLCQPERVLNAIWKGQTRPQPLLESNDEEAYMAMFTEEMSVYEQKNGFITVKRVASAADFRVWAGINNYVLHGGYPIIHPKNHFHLCQKEIMPCYIGYLDQNPASVAAIMHNRGVSSLEFVATLPEYRRKGAAKAVCCQAIADAFATGSKIITLRALPEGKKLFLRLGFKMY